MNWMRSRPICFLRRASEAGAERGAARSTAEQVLGILAERKRMFRMRRPTIIAMLSAGAVTRFLQQGS